MSHGLSEDLYSSLCRRMAFCVVIKQDRYPRFGVHRKCDAEVLDFEKESSMSETRGATSPPSHSCAFFT